MLRLSQQSLSDVALAFAHAGLSEVRDMSSLSEVLLLLRSRIRESAAGTDFTTQQLGLIRAIQPLVQWMQQQDDIQSLPILSKCELAWNIYTAAVSRTSGADSFPLVTASEEAWNEALSRAFGQGSFTVNSDETQVRNEQSGVMREMFPWFLMLLSLGLFGVEQYVESGRLRFYLMLSGAGALVAAITGLFWRYTTAPASRFSHDTGRVLQPTFSSGVRNTAGSSQNLADANVSNMGFQTPPPLAPTLPGNEHVPPATTTPVAELAFAVGDEVGFAMTGEASALHGQTGVVVEVQEGKFMVRLASGLKLGPMSACSMTKQQRAQASSADTLQPQGPEQQNEVYAPFTQGASESRVQAQAARLKTALEKAHALSTTIPSWGQLFWQAVKNENDLYGLEAAVKTTLVSHGYFGPNTQSPPRTDELKKQLGQLETLGGPPHGTGGSVLRVIDSEMVTDPEQMAWHLKLPADLQRAGPEIYRNIRSEGVNSVRQWVNEQHPSLEQKSSPQYQDLFMTATIIDFELAECKTEGMLMAKLATSDALEIHLRRLGAFIYLRRTRDKAGANRILGIRAPGSNTDIAPKWLLDDANLHSKTEFQRQERGAKASKFEGYGGGEVRQRKGDGGRGKKGGGRGKKGGGGGGAASSNTQG